MGTEVRYRLLAAVIALISAPGFAQSEIAPASSDFQPEVYSKGGETIGCGFTYSVAWQSEHAIRSSVGSINFYVQSAKIWGAIVKVRGFVGVEQVVPVHFAWVSTTSENSKRYVRIASDDGKSFVATLQHRVDGMKLLFEAVHSGFTLGISFNAKDLDEVLSVPAPSVDIANKVMACVGEIADRTEQLEKQQ